MCRAHIAHPWVSALEFLLQSKKSSVIILNDIIKFPIFVGLLHYLLGELILPVVWLCNICEFPNTWIICMLHQECETTFVQTNIWMLFPLSCRFINICVHACTNVCSSENRYQIKLSWFCTYSLNATEIG